MKKHNEITKVIGFAKKESHLEWKRSKDESLVDFQEELPYTWEELEISDLVTDEKCIKDMDVFKAMVKKANVQRKSEARSAATRLWYSKVKDYRASSGMSLEDKALRDLMALGMSEEKARAVLKELTNANS